MTRERKIQEEKVKNQLGRGLVVATMVTTSIYLVWRIIFTLPTQYGIWAMIFGVTLLIAEIMGMFEQMLHFQRMSDVVILKKPVCNLADYPTVDVFIATYNEPIDLLYKTVNGCVHMEYPDPSKVKIYLCDDGNRPLVRELAEQFGIYYLTREGREGAKAGNLNHAFANSSGELVVTLDADMIPMNDFLMACVPYFIPDLQHASKLLKEGGVEAKREREDKIGFIQAPQSFYNLDLFQYNLYSEKHIPNEQDYFYRDIQLSKNKSNSVIYGGSNTVISREALEEVGGFVTNVITEDFATGLLIESKGYRCYAIDEVHASGLAPEDVGNLVQQRRRWARGCIQSGRKFHILFHKGLTIKQKLSYISSISYWYDSVKRLIYMLAPIMYGVFGITVFVATPLELLLIWLPMYLINNKTLKYLSGNIRTVHWTNIYETIMFPLLLGDVILEMVGVTQKQFKVTKKGGEKEGGSQVKYLIPHLILAIFTFYGIIRSFYIIFSTGQISIIFLVFWLGANFYNLVMAIFFLSGRKSTRKSVRLPIKIDCTISYGTMVQQGITLDLSEGGFSFLHRLPIYLDPLQVCVVELKSEKYTYKGTAKLIQTTQEADNKGWKYAYQFVDCEEEEYKKLLLILYDRVPPLTESIDPEIGFFEDLQKNIMSRRKKTYRYNRKLPRIPMNYETTLENQQKIKMTNFNYQYVVLQWLDGTSEFPTLELEIEEIGTLKLECVKELNSNEKEDLESLVAKKIYLYEIQNQREVVEQLKDEKQLVKFLNHYMDRRTKEERIEENQREIEQEYDEMSLL